MADDEDFEHFVKKKKHEEEKNIKTAKNNYKRKL